MCTIGVFDSGIGGLTTLKAIKARAPKHRYVYYMDDLNCPYGSKSAREIKALLCAGCEFLTSAGADVVVVACNTATAAAVEEARRRFDLPIIGTEPAVKSASGRTLLLATPLTLAEKRVRRLCAVYRPEIRAAESLAGVIQNNLYSPEIPRRLINELLWDGAEYDTIVLGCTHYVLFRDYIAERFPFVRVVDGNDGVARRVGQIAGSYSFDKKGLFFHCTSDSGVCYADFIKNYLSEEPEFI